MKIDGIKILVILSILIIIGVIYYFMVNKNNCNSDQEYNKILKKCVKKCASNTHYDINSDSCITNCDDGFSVCGDTCYNTTTQQCTPGSKICDIHDRICGTSNTCYNPDKLFCHTDGNLYNFDQVCKNGNVCINKGDRCSTDDSNQCITNCPPTQAVCEKCCDPGEICKDGKCTTCGNRPDLKKCGDICYDPIKQQCINGKVYDCSPDIKVSVNTGCCKSAQVLDSNNNCCDADKIISDGRCCLKKCSDEDNCCDNDCINVNGKSVCRLKCGDDWCDQSQICIQDDKGVNTGKPGCFTKGCEWDDPIQYTPSIMSGLTVKTSIDQNNNYYFVNNPIQTGTQSILLSDIIASDNQSIVSQAECTLGNAIQRASTNDLKSLTFDQISKPPKFTAIFDHTRLPTLDNFNNMCPVVDKNNIYEINRCCSIIDNGVTKLSGQICDKGEVCVNNVCHSNYICDINLDGTTSCHENCKTSVGSNAEYNRFTKKCDSAIEILGGYLTSKYKECCNCSSDNNKMLPNTPHNSVCYSYESDEIAEKNPDPNTIRLCNKVCRKNTTSLNTFSMY